MQSLLYIEASPRKDASTSIAVSKAFLDEFQRTNPSTQISTINLYETQLPEFNGPTIDAKYAILTGQPHSDEQKLAWQKVETLITEFKKADKIVFSVPMWNFGIPYVLKHYIDVIVQPGYTFSYTPGEGYKGLVLGKPVLLICSRGGAYGPESEVDFQKSYMETVLKFIGFTDIRTILVEPTMSPNKSEVLKTAIQMADEMAKKF